jgi:hypothetical protein
MEPQNLTPKQIAEIFNIGLHHLALMRMRGTGPAFIKISGQVGKSGGRVLYPVAGVKEWLASAPTGGGSR